MTIQTGRKLLEFKNISCVQEDLTCSPTVQLRWTSQIYFSNKICDSLSALSWQSRVFQKVEFSILCKDTVLLYMESQGYTTRSFFLLGVIPRGVMAVLEQRYSPSRKLASCVRAIVAVVISLQSTRRFGSNFVGCTALLGEKVFRIWGWTCFVFCRWFSDV